MYFLIYRIKKGSDTAFTSNYSSQTSLHAKAVDTVRFLLSWHDSDPRYSSPEAKQRVAALYLPLLSIAMDVLPILHHFSSDKTQYSTSDDLVPSNINQTVAMAIAGKLPPSTCDTFPSVSLKVKS